MKTLRATRVTTAIRTGSSLPVVVVADDGSTWLVKLRGAGGGIRALVCEAVYAKLADAIDLPVPRRAVLEIAADIESDARHEEVLDVLRASAGTNLGIAFVPDAEPYVEGKSKPPSDEVAARALALDTFAMNVDRTPRNPNILVVQRRDHVFIDHAALLLLEHDPQDREVTTNVASVAGHLFRDRAARFEPEVLRLAITLGNNVLDGAVAEVPTEWLPDADRVRTLLRRRRDAWRDWRAAARLALG